MIRKKKHLSEVDLYQLKVSDYWRAFWMESFSYWMICGYLFTEYVRPQSIWAWADFLPWAQVFLLLALVGWFFNAKEKWQSSRISRWLLFFLFSVFVSSVYAYWPEYSYERFSYFGLWVLIYFLITNIVNSEKRLIIFLLIFLVASYKISLSLSLVWASRGFSFTDWGLQGPPGFFQNSGELAIQMLVYWPIAAALALAFRSQLSRIKYWIMLSFPITAAMVILGASSRGGQLALLVQLAVFFPKKLFNPKALTALLVILALGYSLLPESQKERFQSIGDDRSSRQRLLYWENGIEMMNDHPVIGVGYFNFAPYYERYYTDDMLYAKAQLPHNIFIQVGADLGYLGLSIYLILIAITIIETRRMEMSARELDSPLLRILPRYLNISFVGFLVAGQFVSVVYYPFMWIHLAIVVCIGNLIRKRAAERKNIKTSKQIVRRYS